MMLLALTQRGIGDDDTSKMNIHVGCNSGWTFWLANLKAYLEHGILLHDTEAGELELVEMFEFVNM